MRKWEYEKFYIEKEGNEEDHILNALNKLNEKGKEGWEAIMEFPEFNGFLLLKRQRL